MKIDADDLHCLPDKTHKDCDWYYPEEMECTNWREFMEDCLPAYVECFAPIGSIFKDKKGGLNND